MISEEQQMMFSNEEIEYYTSPDWDILKLNEDMGWEHMQIIYRLSFKGIQCISADIWFDTNIAFLIGVNDKITDIARALNVHEECIYADFEHTLVIINLFQEKYLRGLL